MALRSTGGQVCLIGSNDQRVDKISAVPHDIAAVAHSNKTLVRPHVSPVVQRKYRAGNLMAALQLFAKAREEALASGFKDNGGAIHSVERILDILARRVRHPHLTHINQYKLDPNAEISKVAPAVRQRVNWTRSTSSMFCRSRPSPCGSVICSEKERQT
jgi:hypothetical protein